MLTGRADAALTIALQSLSEEEQSEPIAAVASELVDAKRPLMGGERGSSLPLRPAEMLPLNLCSVERERIPNGPERPVPILQASF